MAKSSSLPWKKRFAFVPKKKASKLFNPQPNSPRPKKMKKLFLTLSILTFALSAALRAAEGPAATPSAPTLEQRLGALEAYIGNTDPSAAVAALKDKDGNLPKDFKMATLRVPGPGHNAWQMASAAFVLFMTLRGLPLLYGRLERRESARLARAHCFFLPEFVP